MRARSAIASTALFLVSTITAFHVEQAFADAWSDVGPSSRPSWVNASVERRLRLLPKLPAIESAIKKSADGYIGNKGPGMAVGLVLEDGLYFSQGYGFADAARTQKPDDETLFRPGSLSKVMTGTALLTLVDAPHSTVDLNDAADSSRYLPELKFVCPDFNHSCARGSQNLHIQLKNLVSHTAGLANVLEQDNASDARWLSDLKKSWVIFGAGDYSAYSGVSAEAEGMIEQRLSNKPYPTFVKDNLFTPLGMTHSTMDPTSIPLSKQAQKWTFGTSHGAATFTKMQGIIGGDDQPMILPAGGFTTSVVDLSLFMRMWLDKTAPDLNGHPMLKASTVASATTPMVSRSVSPPASCGSKSNSNSFSYRECGAANKFGVNWYVGESPFIQHDGAEPGVSGSNTIIDQGRNIAATGMISTEPAPSGVTGVDPVFMDDLVHTMIESAISADAATSWAGKTLSDGVARIFWLSGKTAAASDLSAFTSGFISTNHLTSANVVQFLDNWQNAIGACSTFRVRSVSSDTDITLRFACAKRKWDARLTVSTDKDHKISWTDLSGLDIGTGKPGGQSGAKCQLACANSEGYCMLQAHSSGERQACVHQVEFCRAQCGM